jgi:CMP/dCMP kinase
MRQSALELLVPAAGVAVARPGSEHEEDPGVLEGGHLVTLGRIEDRQQPGRALGGVAIGRGDPDDPIDHQHPGPLVHLVLLQLLALRQVDQDRAALGFGVQHLRLMRLDPELVQVPAVHAHPDFIAEAPRLAAMVIAIDGPAGAGKSTVARGVAHALGFTYLDSGAMYRCVALAALERGINVEAGERLGELAWSLDIGFEGDSIRLDGESVGGKIRSPRVTIAASYVSVHPQVRQAMVKRQRELIAAGNYVAEGRDIGTVVSPDSPLKVFLTAAEGERARRRAADSEESVEEVREAMRERDRRDQDRADSPLRTAEDSIPIDTTDLTPDEVVQRIAELARKRGIV